MSGTARAPADRIQAAFAAEAAEGLRLVLVLITAVRLPPIAQRQGVVY